MRVAFYERTGPAAEVLQVAEWPDPLPAAGEVRVRVQWSGVNPSDVKARAGLRSSVMPFASVVPHSDGMGVIDAVGEGVPRTRIGQRVWIWNAAWGRPFGTAAEFVCLPGAQAVALADNVPGDAAACFGIPALTALHAVELAGGVKDQTVLVAGGAGAVGHYAIQFARLAGARRVFATVSSPAKAMHARAAGADAVIDYRSEDVAEEVRELTAGVGVDRVIEVDISANGALDTVLLRRGGLCVAYGGQAQLTLPFFPLIAKNLGLQFFIVYHLDDAARAHAVGILDAALARGALQHSVALRLPLDRIAEAHQVVEQAGVIGNVVLELP